jgi:hypothetical protein
MQTKRITFTHGWIARSAATVDRALTTAQKTTSPATQTMVATLKHIRTKAAQWIAPTDPQ